MDREFLGFYLLLWLVPLILYTLWLRYRLSMEDREKIGDVMRAAEQVARALPPELARQIETLFEAMARAGVTMNEAAANMHFRKVGDALLHGAEPPTYLLDGTEVVDGPAVEYPDGTALDVYGRLLVDDDPAKQGVSGRL